MAPKPSIFSLEFFEREKIEEEKERRQMSVVKDAEQWGQVEFNVRRREALRKIYKAAVKDGHKTFKYEGHEYLTDYAKYMLDFLDMKLK
jgi:cell fate regulator YaaT (PSP1 superfamily)